MQKKNLKFLIIFLILNLNFSSAFSQQLDFTGESEFLQNLLGQGLSSQLNEYQKDFSAQQKSIIDDTTNSFTEEELKAIKKYYYISQRELTSLEKEYALRSNTNLLLQGYDVFGKLFETSLESSSIRQGAVQDNYLIGLGDEIVLQLQGEANRLFKERVLNNGSLVFPFTEPILASGLTFGELKKEIKRRVEISYVETEAYITLGEIKQINVTVSGGVNIPGQYKVSSLSNIIDLIVAAGGVSKNGSMRNITLFSNGKEQKIDLYEILYGINKGQKSPVPLSNGSLIIIPPITKTIAITGSVNNPGIYEINENEFTIEDIFLLSGKSSFSNEFFVKRVNKDFNETIEYELNKNSFVKNGDIIFVLPKQILTKGTVNVSGAVKFPFEYPLEKYPTVSSIIKGISFLEKDAFKFSYIIRSLNQNTQKYEYKSHNLLDILNKKIDINLDYNDEIFIFRKSDLDFILNEEIVNSLNPTNDFSRYNFSCSSVKKLNEYVKASSINNKNSFYSVYTSLFEMISEIDIKNDNSSNKGTSTNIDQQTCPKIFESNPDLLIEIIKSIVIVKGEVSDPGVYFVNEGASLKSLVLHSGYSGGNILVSPDKRNINVISNNIELSGSVRFPQKLSFEKNLSLKKLVPDASYVFPNTYPLFGLIKRRIHKTGINEFITFNPEQIFSNTNDISLQNGDIVKFYSQSEISNIVETVLSKNNVNFSDSKFENLLEDFIENENSNNLVDENADYGSGKQALVDLIQNLDKENLENYANLFSLDELEKIKVELQKIESIEVDKENDKIHKNTDNDKDLTKTQEHTSLDNKNLSLNAKDKNISLKTVNEDIILENIIRSNLVHLAGRVVVPGFYPIGDTAQINSLISIAGGLENDADANRIEIQKVNNKSKDFFNSKNTVEPGDKLFFHSNNIQKESIMLTGSIENERSISFESRLLLSDVIFDIKDLKKEAFLYFGTINRSPTENKPGYYKVFSPQKVISGEQVILLEKGDIIKFYSEDEIRNLVNDSNIINVKNINFSNNVSDNSSSVQNLVKKYLIKVKGAIKNPGNFLLGGEYNVEEIIDIMGGFSEDADRKNIDVLQPIKREDGNITFEQKLINFETNDKLKFISPGSVIRVPKFLNDLDLGQVIITGEVKEPGSYQILKDDTIYTLLKRTGGLSKSAFLDGLVFSRVEEQEREKASLERLKNELEKSISLSLESIGNKMDLSSLAGMQEIINLASNAKPIGRIVGNFTNIELLKSTFIVDGDKIFIPKKPTSITIVGETLTPGSILWDRNNSIDDYLESVAGFTELADKKRIFLIEPNGKSRRVSGFWKNNNSIKPGSTIVVPRRIVLASNLEKVSAVTSIIYQLTLSLAGIESVLND